MLAHGCPVINEREYDYHRERMHTAKESECSFYAMPTLAANRQATINEGDFPCTTMCYKNMAIRTINQSLTKYQATEQIFHDGVLFAVLDLADDEVG